MKHEAKTFWNIVGTECKTAAARFTLVLEWRKAAIMAAQFCCLNDEFSNEICSVLHSY